MATHKPQTNKNTPKPSGIAGKLMREASRIIEQLQRNLWRLIVGFGYRKKVSGGELKHLTLDPGIPNGVFHVLVRNVDGRRTIVKIPRLDSSAASRKLFRLVKSHDGSERYKRHLTGLAENVTLSAHLPKIVSIGRFGGYESAFVEGTNLADLVRHIYRRMELPAGIDPEGIEAALDRLLFDLDAYQKAGGAPCGDWALHNLVFDGASGEILNVDLEGFFTYGEKDVEASPQFAKEEFTGLTALLKLASASTEKERKILAARSAIWHTTASGSTYSGARHLAGYHSIEILGSYLRGQRECRERLAKVPFDFSGKIVLDVGCNVGGMLHALSGRVAFATGIDYDAKCINAANVVARVNDTMNLSFFTFNLERDDLASIVSLTLGRKIDICFLLSVCMWIRNWREVVDFLATRCEHMLFESNGSQKQQDEQIEHIRQRYASVELILEGSPDDPGQQERSLYLCSGSRSGSNVA